MDETSETCKLCLKCIQGNSVAALDEGLLTKLDFIQLDLERSVEQSNSICTQCKEKIQNAFDFKFCLVQTESSDLGSFESKTQNICDIPSTSRGESSTEKTICRLCKNSVAVISVISLEKLLKDYNVMEVFQGHIPEMELKESENSMVCEPCQKSLASFSMLVSSWSIANDWNEDDEDDMKEDMEHFGAVEVKKEVGDDFSDSNTNSACAVGGSSSGKIVKKTKGNHGQVTKVKTESDEESDCSESVSVNDKDVKKEESEEEGEEADLQLKDEEVDIKDEDENEHFVYQEKQHIETSGHKINVRENIIGETIDGGELSHRADLVDPHSRYTQNEVEVFKYSEFSYVPKYKSHLNRHLKNYRSFDDVKVFKCSEYSYIIKHKPIFNTHMKIHKSLEAFKCSECPYVTKYKSSLTRHLKNHKSLNEVDVFKCSECSFVTKQKSNLTTHLKIHLRLNEVDEHLKIHKSVDIVELFKCPECSFVTKHKGSLYHHSKIHKSFDEVKVFKCSECSYVTKHKSHLTKHLKIHKRLNEVFKCLQCSYICKRKSSFTKHFRIHKILI